MNASPTAWKWGPLLAGAVIVLAALAAYHNSFSAPFIFDDEPSILENRTIRQVWPIWPALSPPKGGSTVDGRPVVNLTLAVNYALGGTDVRGYHTMNLAIHILAGLTLFGVVRRTLQQPGLSERFGGAALPLALATALIWTVHPLQTESVTYIVQRAESLMGLFYLLTLYCFIRGSVPNGWQPYGHASPTNHLTGIVGREGLKAFAPKIWYMLAVVACLLGMASKEVMVAAPLIVMLYDRTFISGTFREAWRQRWPLYLALAATWILRSYLMVSAGSLRTASAHAKEIGFVWWEYLLTEPGVILHYLKLCVWPHKLCLDYGWPIAKTWSGVLPPALVIVTLLGATCWALKNRSAPGFVGASFFLILAPTSSFLPLDGPAFEHRMYLPLAAVVVTVVISAFTLGKLLLQRRSKLARSLGWGTAVVVLPLLTNLTIRRNADYGSGLTIWQDTANKRPNNPRAHFNLGNALVQAGRVEEAIGHYEQTVRLKPDFAVAQNKLANALIEAGKVQEAIGHYEEAVRLEPAYAKAHYGLALALVQAGRVEEAVKHYEQVVRINPTHADAHNNLAWILATDDDQRLRDPAKAVQFAERACQLAERRDPWFMDTLAAAYAEVGRFNDAIHTAQQAVSLADAAGLQDLAKDIQGRLELYKVGQPFRQKPTAEPGFGAGLLTAPNAGRPSVDDCAGQAFARRSGLRPAKAGDPRTTWNT